MRMMFTRMDPFVFKPGFLARLASRAFVGTYYSEEKHPISRAIFKVYDPVCRWVLRRPWTTILIAVAIVAVSIPAYFRLGSEFMPPLNEGTILYMPTTLPGISVAEAQALLQTQDRVLKSFPEVERVFGKAGRAETSTEYNSPLSCTSKWLYPAARWAESMWRMASSGVSEGAIMAALIPTFSAVKA